MARMERMCCARRSPIPRRSATTSSSPRRETAELRAETLQMGQAPAKLLPELGIEVLIESPAYPTAYAVAVRHWRIEPRDAALAYLWSWLENQVMAAVKAVPLGQTAGQKMLLALGDRLLKKLAPDAAARRNILVELRARSSRALGAPRNAVLEALPVMTLRVGIGGPVGSGKTALTLALCRALREPLRDRGGDERHLHRGGRAVPGAQRGARARADHRRRDRRLPAHRDPRGRLDQPRGGRALARRFPRLDVVFVESGGDNLAATFSPELSDLTLYVIDVAAGDKIPRKGGPGITKSDLLVINKIDLAPDGRRIARGDGARCEEDARRAPVRLHQPEERAGPRRRDPGSSSARACSRRKNARGRNASAPGVPAPPSG